MLQEIVFYQDMCDKLAYGAVQLNVVVRHGFPERLEALIFLKKFYVLPFEFFLVEVSRSANWDFFILFDYLSVLVLDFNYFKFLDLSNFDLIIEKYVQKFPDDLL